MEELGVFVLGDTGSEYYNIKNSERAKVLIEVLINNNLKNNFVTADSFCLEIRNEKTMEKGFLEETGNSVNGWEDICFFAL